MLSPPIGRVALLLASFASQLPASLAAINLDDFDYHNRATTARCEINRTEYWDFVTWYFSRSFNIHVILLSRDEHSSRYADTYNSVLQRLMQHTNLAVTISTRVLSFEGDHIGHSDYSSWQGTPFQLRPNQSAPSATSRRAKRQSDAPPPKTPGRKDEPERGIMVIVENIGVLSEYLRGTARSPFRSPRDNYVVVVRFVEQETEEWRATIESVLARMWLEYGIENVFVMAPCTDSGQVDQVATYYPFEVADANETTIGGRNESDYGRCRWSSVDAIEFSMRTLRRLSNMNGYPFRVSIFDRYPTAVKLRDMHPVLADSYFNALAPLAGGFGGFDGLVLANLAERLNFRSVVVTPVGSDYGWVADNGTFYGSIGDVLYRRAQISVNGRFVADYGTAENDFLYPVFFDQFCIIAPKSLRVPEWLAIFKCFSTTVWALIIGTNIVCACGWYAFQKLACRATAEKLPSRVEFGDVFIEMWKIMLSAASIRMPFSTLERIFMAACLLGNLIIAGSFQGSLTTSFSTTSYYKDIDTLAELDASGLPIGTTSASLADIFGDGDTPILRSLISKFRLLTSGPPTIERTAYNRDICCVERCADIRLIIVSQYERPDGTVLLHAIAESPKTSHISYFIKKGWPFKPVFQELVSRFTEAGLLETWYRQNQNAIIQQQRIARRNFQEELRVLALSDVQTAFYILGIGELVCVGIWVAEMVAVKWRWRRRGARKARGKKVG